MANMYLTSRKGIHMFEHPIVQEYLKTYDGIINFKEALAKFFVDKGESFINNYQCQVFWGFYFFFGGGGAGGIF